MRPAAMGSHNLSLAMIAGLVSFLLLLSTSGFAHAAAYVKPGFGAVHNAALLGADMSPRYFLRNSIPATPGKKRELLARQDDDGSDEHRTDCGNGKHSCYGVGGSNGASVCCPNDQYCFADKDWSVKCCHFDAGCDDICTKQDQQLCNATSTVVTTNTITKGSSTTEQVQNNVETQSACCPRACGVSSFQCVIYFGNQCCPNDQQCATSGQCVSNITPTPTPVTPIPEGCTATTQIACPEQSGGGCCDIGQTCIGSTLCGGPTGTSAADTSGSGSNSGGGGGLSQQTKAGIGVGVVVAAALVIGGLTWFCVRRRRQDRAAGSRSRTNTSGGGGGGGGSGARAALGGGFGALGGGIAGGRRRRGEENHYDSGAEGGDASGPSTAFLRDRDLMSEISGPTSGGGGPSRPALHSSGLTYDYFGPDAIAGPYTTPGDGPDGYDEGDSDYYGVGGAAAAGTIGPDGQYHMFPTPGLSTHLPQQERGVPLQPRGPEDITAPVEIDSNKPGGGGGGGGEGDLTPAPQLQQQQQQEQQDFGPFELFGSPGLPPTMGEGDAAGAAGAKNGGEKRGGGANDNNDNADFGDSPTNPQLEQDMKARALDAKSDPKNDP